MARTKFKNKRYITPETELTFRKDYRAYLFPLEFVKDQHATNAAIRCGYDPKMAGQIGHNLKVKFKNKINALLYEKLHKIELTVEDLMQEMAKLATVNPHDFYDEEGRLIPIHLLPRHLCAAIASFDVDIRWEKSNGELEKVESTKYKLWNKKDAIETLMKLYGLIIDKHELTGKKGKPLFPTKTQSTHVYKFDPTELTTEQLKALIVLEGNNDPLADKEDGE